jgi:cyclopropane fatty-acyl-phospholipid synthase-like methyltransferase
MYWNDQYDKNKHLWGKDPSELARAAVGYMKKHPFARGTMRILDIGCGYGRDAFYYADALDCTVLGVDVSEKAIEIASKEAAGKGRGNIRFVCEDFGNLGQERFDAVTASNLYQLLRSDERNTLRTAIRRVLEPHGLLFLSTLSITDPEHAGKGVPIPGESNSYQYGHRLYLHHCAEDELRQDFAFLNVKELFEHEYDEPRATGNVHHHISWILIGETRAQ